MMRRRLAELFGVDLRSLALFRIALAALLLADLARRAGDFTAFYTEAGVLPVEAVRGLAARCRRSSLRCTCSPNLEHTLAVAALFALAAAAAVSARDRLAHARRDRALSGFCC
jgi:hypothetical protein